MDRGKNEAGGASSDDTLTDMAWISRVGALTAEPTDDHETARAAAAEALAFRLISVSAALCAAQPEQPLPDDAAAALARRLATGSRTPADAAPPAAGGRGPATTGRTPPAADDFLEALSDATVAVYFCRSTQHPGNRCWFSPWGPADGLCGEVLALAHRLASPPGAYRMSADHTGWPR